MLHGGPFRDRHDGEGSPGKVIEALREEREIPDARLEVLSRFAKTVVGSHGWPGEADLQAVLGAGYTPESVPEVILVTAFKTLRAMSTSLPAPLRTSSSRRLPGAPLRPHGSAQPRAGRPARGCAKGVRCAMRNANPGPP